MNKNLLLLISVYLLPIILYSFEEKCYLLALEGGGNKGAYQAGAFDILANNLNSSINQYNVISGVSIGALNGGLLVQYKEGEEKEAAKSLLNLWFNISSSKIYEEWPLGILDGLFFHSGILSVEPLKKLINEHFTRNISRKFSFGSTNANNGTFKRFTENNVFSREDHINAILASSAFPIIFPKVNFENTSYIDGGVLSNLDVAGGIFRCRETIKDDKNIIVDVIMCSGRKIIDEVVEDFNAFQMIFRTYELEAYKSSLEVLLKAFEDFPDVTFRFIMIPSQTLPSGLIPLSFSKAQIEEMISIGEKDALNAIANRTGNVANKKYVNSLMKEMYNGPIDFSPFSSSTMNFKKNYVQNKIKSN